MAGSAIISVQEAAERLGVHRSRVEALILSGVLPAAKTGSQWILDRRELDLYDNVRPHRRGRPLSAAAAWVRIANSGELLRRREPGLLDAERRDLRARATHEPLHVHPGVLGDALDDPSLRLGGRAAAIAAGAPLHADADVDGVHDVYVPAGPAVGWKNRVRARPERVAPNVWLHIVPDDAWDHLPGDGHLGLFVAWLDLADRLDRGADLVLDRLGRGRARA